MKYVIVAILAVLMTLIVCYLLQRNNNGVIKGSDVDPVVNIRYMEIRDKDGPLIRMEMSYIGTVLSTANISFLEKNKNEVYMLMGAMPFNEKSWAAFLYNSKSDVEETGSLQVLSIDKISSNRASWLYFSEEKQQN